jgi:hypothetical protein
MPLSQKTYNAVAKQTDRLVLELIQEIKAQGHIDTSALIQSVESDGDHINDGVEFNVMMEEHWVYPNYGVKASKIRRAPFAPARVDALKEFWKRKGLSDDDAEGAAYGTIQNWLKRNQGMPSENSYRFSDNGRRKEFLEQIVEQKDWQLILNDDLEQALEDEFVELLKIKK